MALPLIAWSLAGAGGLFTADHFLFDGGGRKKVIDGGFDVVKGTAGDVVDKTKEEFNNLVTNFTENGAFSAFGNALKDNWAPLLALGATALFAGGGGWMKFIMGAIAAAVVWTAQKVLMPKIFNRESNPESESAPAPAPTADNENEHEETLEAGSPETPRNTSGDTPRQGVFNENGKPAPEKPKWSDKPEAPDNDELTPEHE